MNKLLLIIFSLLCGIFIGKIYFISDIKNETIEISPKNIELNNSANISIIEKIKVIEINNTKIIYQVPFFIKQDLDYEGFSSVNITLEDWENFLFLKSIERYKQSPEKFILIALESDSIEFFELLKNSNIEIDLKRRDNSGNSLIKIAFRKSNFTMIRYLIENDYIAIDDIVETQGGKNDLLQLVLYRIEDSNKFSLINYLVNSGIDIRDKKYIGSLLRSSNKNIYEYSEQIIHNSDILQDNNDINIIARYDTKGDAIRYVLDNLDFTQIQKGSFLLISSSNKHISNKLFKEIVKKDFNINFASSYTLQTPLMNAVNNGDIDKVKILLENGANKELKDFRGRDILDVLENSKSLTSYEYNEIKEILYDY